ncbi:MAG: hypothetical protein ACFFFK_06885 [Candidatus Thorarchaeota archaeon]
MKKSLFDILDAWTLIFDRIEMEITLNDVSYPFNEKRLKFRLLEDLWDLFEMMDNPDEFMTDIRMSNLVVKFLRGEGREDVAKFVQIEVSGPPGLRMEVLNVEETITQFPDWFEPLEGMTFGDFKSSLFK